jgi:hypothetical protein
MDELGRVRYIGMPFPLKGPSSPPPPINHGFVFFLSIFTFLIKIYSWQPWVVLAF